MLRPVAVIIMSAFSSSPESSFIPSEVNSSMVSVTTDAFPELIASKISPFGTRHRR